MEHGFTVVAHYNNSDEDAAELAKWAESRNLELKLISFDLNKIDDINKFYDGVNALVGEIDVLINNASTFTHDNFFTMDPNTFMHAMNLNCLAPILLMQRFLSHPQTNGAICINVLDQKVENINPDFCSYTLAKAALGVASRIASMSIKRGLRVNSISPGLTLRSGNQSDSNFEAAQRANPLGRGPTPDAIADGVLFLISNESINGYNLIIDAGEHLLGRTRDVSFLKNEDL